MFIDYMLEHKYLPAPTLLRAFLSRIADTEGTQAALQYFDIMLSLKMVPSVPLRSIHLPIM